MITQEFDLNMIPDSEPVVVHVNQYDIGSGRLIAHLYDKDQPYAPDNATVIIQGTKPDRHGFAYDAEIVGNTVTADLTQQMCAVKGITRTQILVNDTYGRTGTFVFDLCVQESALQDDTDISETELPAIIDLARHNADIAVAAAEAAAESETNAEASAQTAAESEDNAADSATSAAASESNAEAWAVGERGGQAVPTTDPTYQNNSKYYSDRALTSEINAAASEANAAASETNAATSETNAAISATNAAESEENAATSETNAADSASAAATSKDNAAASEINAATSESNAATSESNAEAWAVGQRAGIDVPNTDATYHNNSKYYSGIAGTHASNAESSEQAAKSSEQAAKSSEQAAKASEEILEYYVHYVIPRFIIQNNRLYINDLAQGEFIVANNRLYIRNPD